MKWTLYEGDCFDYLPLIEDGSVDMILCDLPYGTTACKWDTPLPLDELWMEYKRVIKDNGAIVLTASQPFTSYLVMSNPELFKYSWVWDKKATSTALLAKYQPLKKHEDVLVFYKKFGAYNPQKIECKRRVETIINSSNGETFGGDKKTRSFDNKGMCYPKSIIEISNANHRGRLHPTQKPVALFEYLIKTYTNENDLVLDNCAGSGTTGVACMNLNRNCIMMEKEPEYCEIIKKRMNQTRL